jgi:hypothetical protein
MPLDQSPFAGACHEARVASGCVHTCVRARDPDASLRFYRALGFSTPRDPADG